MVLCRHISVLPQETDRQSNMENGTEKTLIGTTMDYDSENSLTIDSDEDVGQSKEHKKLDWPKDSFLPESDLESLDMNMENKNTLRKTDTDIRILISYLRSKNECRPPESIPPMDLDKYLSTFFTIVKKHDGNDYEPASLRGMLCSVERYLKLKSYPASVTRDYIFSNTRNALKLKQQRLRELGKGNKRPIESFGPVTLEKVNHLFKAKEMGPYTPMSVINTLCFAFIVHFRLRKAIDHKNMLWGDVTLKKDRNGRECLCYEPISPRSMRKDQDKISLPALADDTEKDTIQIYKLYAEKRPSNMNYANAPFYLGITTIYPSAVQAWYRTCAMGVNKLSDLVRMIRAMTGLPRASIHTPIESVLMKRQFNFNVSKAVSENNRKEIENTSKPESCLDDTDVRPVPESSVTSLTKIYTDVERDDVEDESAESLSGLSSCTDDSKDHQYGVKLHQDYPISEKDGQAIDIKMAKTYFAQMIQKLRNDSVMHFKEWLSTIEICTDPVKGHGICREAFTSNSLDEELPTEHSGKEDTGNGSRADGLSSAKITLNITLAPRALMGKGPITVTATSNKDSQKKTENAKKKENRTLSFSQTDHENFDSSYVMKTQSPLRNACEKESPFCVPATKRRKSMESIPMNLVSTANRRACSSENIHVATDDQVMTNAWNSSFSSMKDKRKEFTLSTNSIGLNDRNIPMAHSTVDSIYKLPNGNPAHMTLRKYPFSVQSYTSTMNQPLPHISNPFYNGNFLGTLGDQPGQIYTRPMHLESQKSYPSPQTMTISCNISANSMKNEPR